MGTTLSLLKKFEQLDTDSIAVDSIDETKEVLKERQRDQLLHGFDSKGNKIGRYRNAAYAAKKYSQNPLAGLGNVDLKLTGELHKEIFVDVRNDSLVIDSSDEKTGKLIEKYGDPFGLTSDSRIKYINESLRLTFFKKIRQKIRL